MPTAAKLVAALCFAFLAWVVCIVIESVMPADQRVGQMYPVSIVAGGLCGWFISGAAKRARYIEASFTGIRTAIIAVLVSLLAFSVGTMLEISMRGRYRGPMEALLDIVNQFVDYASLLVSVEVAVVLLAGGAIAGMITESAGRRWR